jgi:hypothetical protein
MGPRVIRLQRSAPGGGSGRSGSPLSLFGQCPQMRPMRRPGSDHRQRDSRCDRAVWDARDRPRGVRRDQMRTASKLRVNSGDRKQSRGNRGRRERHQTSPAPRLLCRVPLTGGRGRVWRLPLLRLRGGDRLGLLLEHPFACDPLEPTGLAYAVHFLLRVGGNAGPSRSRKPPGQPVAPSRVIRECRAQLEHRPNTPGLSPVGGRVTAESGRALRQRWKPVPAADPSGQEPIFDADEHGDQQQVSVAVAATPVSAVKACREPPALMLDDQKRVPICSRGPGIARPPCPLLRDPATNPLVAGVLEGSMELPLPFRRQQFPRGRRGRFRHGRLLSL